MIFLRPLMRATRGAAVVEMALVTPLLLIIMMGSMELGNYFLDEHALVKGVRDGARFAARQSFATYPCPAGGTLSTASTPGSDVKNIINTGQASSGGTNRLPQVVNPTISWVCKADLAGGTTNPPSGIYKQSSGTPYAPVVTVSATVAYTPIMKSFGFRGTGLNLNANQQAAVMGI